MIFLSIDHIIGRIRPLGGMVGHAQRGLPGGAQPESRAMVCKPAIAEPVRIRPQGRGNGRKKRGEE